MSLIYGIKTQDGVYLAADTRLTRTLPTGEKKYEDDFSKFHTFGKYMHLLAAGDACLASYLVQKIQKSELANCGYFEFIEKIEAFVGNEIGFYPRIQDCPKVVFIFAGHDSSRKDEMSMKKWAEYSLFMQGGQNISVPVRLTEPVKQAMFKASTERKAGDILELDKPYIGLCSLEIVVTTAGVETRLTESEWASYLMFGPKGLDAKDAPKALVVALDIGQKAKGLTKGDVLFENALHLIKFFLKAIPAYDLDTVGGSIFVTFISEWGALLPEGEVGLQKPDGSKISLSYIFGGKDNKFYTKYNGETKPIRHLTSFYQEDGKMDLGEL